MRNIDGLIPQLCALAREHGEEKKRLPIRAAALQALAALVYFFTYLMECAPGAIIRFCYHYWILE